MLKFMQQRFELITEKEIKDMDRDNVQKFLMEARLLFLKYFRRSEIIQIHEEIELNLALKFLTSPYLEKKLKGINEIKEISDKIEKSFDTGE